MRQKTEMLAIIILVIACFSSCKFTLPTQTADESSSNEIISKWSPYVGVFPGISTIQETHLSKLANAGMVRGVRLGWLHLAESQRLARSIQSMGIEVMGLFENDFLRAPDVCEIFSGHVRNNPGVVYWEIGNEITYVKLFQKEYVEIVKKLFFYAKQHHPEIIIVSGGIGGNVAAADSLRQMIDAGLDKLCRDGLKVVTIHFYSLGAFTRIAEFKSQIMRLPSHVRIFITEANTMPPTWNNQISYVKEMYPQLRDALRAERIYWYAFCGDGDFALVRMNTWEYSPLMKLLVGETGAVNDNQTVSTQEFFEGPYIGFPEPPGFRGPGLKEKHQREKKGRR